jgi:hypothetical protein
MQGSGFRLRSADFGLRIICSDFFQSAFRILQSAIDRSALGVAVRDFLSVPPAIAGLPIADCGFRTADFGLRIICSAFFQSAFRILQSAIDRSALGVAVRDFLSVPPAIAGLPIADCGFRTADYMLRLLPIRIPHSAILNR